MPDTSAVKPGTGTQLELYWTKGEGLLKWVNSPHPWTTLYNHLVKFVEPEFAKRLTEHYFVIVFGYHSGSRKGTNPVGPG